MIIEIGIVAGEVINLLERTKRPLTITEVEILVDRPIDIIYMALGWLIREHFVHVVEASGSKYLFVEKKPVPLANHRQFVREHLN